MMQSAAEDAISLALAFYQNPTRYHNLLHGRAPLPPGVDRLLRLAGGASLEELGIPPGALANREELLKAAQFFIEQVLLAHDANHYRLLGVAPDARIEQIKEHHRLLMRLFHPDRSDVDESKAAYATRINLAYNTLRQADSRAAYDVSLRQARSTTPAQVHPRQFYRHAQQHHSGTWQSMPPWMVRNLPQFVLGGVALITAVSVGSVYLDRQPVGAIGWEPGEKTGVLAATAQHVAAPLPGGQAQQAPETKPKISAPVTPTIDLVPPPAVMASKPLLQARTQPAALVQENAKPASATPPATRLALANRQRPGVATAIQPTMAKGSPTPASPPALARPAPAAPVPAPMPATAVPPPAPAQPVAAVTANETAATPPAPPKPNPPPRPALSEAELVRLLSRISHHYANGDLENFLALFDESARSGNDNKTQIRNDYANLFRDTSQRDLVIWDMEWKQHGETAIGEGSFQARVLRNGEAAPRVYHGQINIEVVKRADAPLIRAFNHTVKR